MRRWRGMVRRIRLFFNLCCDKGANPFGQSGRGSRSHKRGKIMVKPAIIARCGKKGGFGIIALFASINGQLIDMAGPIFSRPDIG